MNDELYHYHGGELYHYGVPGMKWGMRKAKLQAKAEAYRKAAADTKSREKKNKYLDKADKFEDRATSLDTKKGRKAYDIKKGAAITAGVLGVVGAIKIAELVGSNKTVGKFKNWATNMDEDKWARFQYSVRSL